MSKKLLRPNLFSRQQKQAHNLHSHNDWIAADEDCVQMKNQDKRDRAEDQKTEQELATHVKRPLNTTARRMS